MRHSIALIFLLASFACAEDPAGTASAGAGGTPGVGGAGGGGVGGTGVGGVGGSGGVACVPALVDATEVDGVLLGLPANDVATAPPIVTPPVAATPPSAQFPKQVAVLNVSPAITDAQAIVHMLAPMGIPYAITTSPMLAIQHDMAVFFPEASPFTFDATALDLLVAHVSGGGVVVMKYSDVPELEALGGVVAGTFQLEHHWVDLTAAGEARFPSLDRSEERHIPLGGDAVAFLNTWTLEVDPAASDVSVLATFEDGTAAIVAHGVGQGTVYTFGLDWRDVVLRNQLGHSLDAARGYVNVFEPATDTWMLMLRDLYDTHVRFGVRLATAPDGLRASVLLTHDLDWGPSYENALVYAAEEQASGASATYFVHTKYVTDAQDTAFFGGERGEQLASLLAFGATVGSHTVAHSPVLHTLSVGDGAEVYPAYAPRNSSITETEGATLFGEARVSKSLIDGALDARCVAHDTVTFRAGNLAYHMESPQTLERLGYRFDATRAVGTVLAHFPFRAMTDWPDALDTTIFEIPLTIEDQKAPRFDERVPQTLDIIAANADNGAPTTILLHPNVLDYKQNGQRAILNDLPDGVNATSLEHFAEFWRSRDAVVIDLVNYDDIARVLTVDLRAPIAVDGLTLRVDPSIVEVASPVAAVLLEGIEDDLVVLPPMAAGQELSVVLRYE